VPPKLLIWSSAAPREKREKRDREIEGSRGPGRDKVIFFGSDANLAEHEAVGDSLLLAGTAAIACWSKRLVERIGWAAMVGDRN
jgi:hypothetical protein